MEWEFVRFHKSVGAKYQLQNVITNEWCEHPLDSAYYGRPDFVAMDSIQEHLLVFNCSKLFCTLKIILPRFSKILRKHWSVLIMSNLKYAALLLDSILYI